MGFRQRRSWRFSADSRQPAEHFPGVSLPLRVVLPCFAFGVVAGGLSRGHRGRCARGGSVVRFLKRAVLCEVGEDDSDGCGFFDAGHDPHRAAAVAAVLTSMLTKSPGAIWNSRKAGPKGGGQDARSNTRWKQHWTVCF